MDYSGYLTALGTSIMFACGSIFFTISGRTVTSVVVNRVRLLMAFAILMIIHLISFGSPFPFNAAPERFVWFGLSGVVGLALGDFFLFQAFVLVGPRLAMLMMALSSVLSAVMAFLFFGEVLTLIQIIGILITIVGIGLVVTEKRADEKDKGKPKNEETPLVIEETETTLTEPMTQATYLKGLLYGFLAACGQAGGTILSKEGLGGDFSPISANLIRMLAAVIAIWVVAIVQRQVGFTVQQVRKYPKSLLLMVGGTVLGPVSGVLLNLYSVQHAPVGIASTLASLMPIFLIPISYVVFGERITVRSVVATLIAFAGIALLFVK